MAKTFNPHTRERAIYDAEQQARRYDSPMAVCQSVKKDGEIGYWPWPYQAAVAVFCDQIVMVALPGSHPGAKEKARRNDAEAIASFATDWK